jgi:hypothetical protein
MKKPENKPESLCMAPWTHTYLSPQTERRLCCASREPAQNFEQYIDTSGGTGEYTPQTLEEYWNSERVRSVRRQMMSGETPDECVVCDKKLLNTDVYRDYFWHLFKHKHDELWNSTDETGYTTMKPISWDYRFSNLCNFKCRQCGDMLSSAWETESKKNQRINWDNPQNNWLKPEVNKKIKQFQQTVVEEEFSQAVEQHRVEEIYWVGGEPLMYEQHWQYMKRIIELGDGPGLYARYNTNLSRVNYKGINLYTDILANIRDWEICASIDGTNEIGEYVRTGLNYKQWLDNYLAGVEFQHRPSQMRLDYTITLPGLFDAVNMFELSKKTNTQLLTKITFTFSPDVAMSPLLLPREILDSIVDDILQQCTDATWKQQPLIDTLHQLKSRQTTQEQWPEQYEKGWQDAKRKVERLESIRKDTLTLNNILERNKSAHEWWQGI